MKIPTLHSAYSKINNLLYKSYLPNIINAALDIEIFETLSGRSLTLSEIVQQINTNKHITESLLNVLVSIELLEQEGAVFCLSPDACEYLTKQSEVQQIQATKKFAVGEGPFCQLTESLKGNIPIFDPSIWSSKQAISIIEQNAKAGALQHALSFVKDIPQFKKAVKMCDFAGNSGYYSFAFMQVNPSLYSQVYDLPDLCNNAREIKKDELDFNRIAYVPFNIKSKDSFGRDFDFFFASHCLYEFSGTNILSELLKKMNHAMKPGALFVSNHMNGVAATKDDQITISIVELMTRAMGYPTHELPEEKLKQALSEAGFGKFNIKKPNENMAFPTLLLSAIKIKEI